MPVRNIECQIARSQIGRYLSGDSFSPEALRQLEAHVAECDDCKESLNHRKAALQAMLGSSPAAVVDVVETTPKASLGRLFKKKTSETSSAKIQPTTFWKPMAYSLALGAVLITMSLYSKALTQPFGNKVLPADDTTTSTASVAASALPATVATPPKPDFDIKTGETPETDKPAPILTKPEVKTESPVTTSQSTTPPTPAPALADPQSQVDEPAAEPAPKAKAKRARHQRKHKKATHERVRPSTIRVYDPNGNLISR